MYNTQHISQSALNAITVPNAKEVKLLTGEEFNPVYIHDQIKRASDNFSKKDDKAIKADRLLYSLLNGKTTTDIETILKIQEMDRLRMIALLELELLIAA